MKDDKRIMLRIKVKALAEEARIIRKEERRLPGPNALRAELHWHRIGVVRYEARATHIAYGLIRGRPLERIERSETRTEALWEKVRAMIKKYGPAADKEMLLALCKA